MGPRRLVAEALRGAPNAARAVLVGLQSGRPASVGGGGGLRGPRGESPVPDPEWPIVGAVAAARSVSQPVARHSAQRPHPPRRSPRVGSRRAFVRIWETGPLPPSPAVARFLALPT